MKFTLSAAIVAGISLIALGQISAQAQTPTTPAPAQNPAPAADAPNRVTGAVTVANGNALTVHDRRANNDVNVAVTTDTKFTKQVAGPLSSITAGAIVNVRAGADIPAGTTTVDATRIEILTELPKEPNTNARYVVGTVVTTTPALTIKTVDGTTVTINTTPDIEVLSTVPAALSDVVVGSYVSVNGKNDGVTLTAKELRIMPARKPRQ